MGMTKNGVDGSRPGAHRRKRLEALGGVLLESRFLGILDAIFGSILRVHVVWINFLVQDDPASKCGQAALKSHLGRKAPRFWDQEKTTVFLCKHFALEPGCPKVQFSPSFRRLYAQNEVRSGREAAFAAILPFCIIMDTYHPICTDFWNFVTVCAILEN